jgi:type III restriction enzyme
MKLKFDPSLDYQHDAIRAMVDLFEGQPLAQTDFELTLQASGRGVALRELAVGNEIHITDEQLLHNIHRIQERNGVEKSPSGVDAVENWDAVPDVDAIPLLTHGRDFSIEMETGTGKTYVYLRTIFELNKTYGFKKFIIVVPSIAIREGVLKSIDIMRDHFRALYSNVPFHHFVYDSRKLEKVNTFARDNTLQIMIINIQSFQREANVFNQEVERCHGYRPKDLIAATSPFLIIDEPQSVDSGEKSREAIRSLSASATFRYSATHRNLYNLLYRLDPVKAYDLRLVKRIEVASVRSDNNFNDSYVKLLKTDNKNGIKAQVEIHQEGRDGTIKPTKLWVKKGDDLFLKSGEREIYRQGYVVQNIDTTPGAEYVEFNQGRSLSFGQDFGGAGEELMRAQVFETVEQHLKKERAFKGKGIKVLSLFFIDKVANYRQYHADGTTGLGKIGLWFEEAFQELTAKPLYQGLIPHPVDKVHDGYFSADRKKGKIVSLIDTSGTTAKDDETYNLIMKDKERLLDGSEPLRFIFSHSALREGWDNPNIFQICTLNETRSIDKKRQEIGRGLRLAVNAVGERVHDEHINRLTVIANESYEEFARKLQSEFEEDYGIAFGRVEKIAFAKLVRPSDPEERPIGQEHSKAIWQNLVQGGYLTPEGRVQDTFDPKNSHFELKIAPEHAELRPAVMDVISASLFKNRIVNAREKRSVHFNKQVQLSDDFSALWSRISPRTRYRVAFDTDALIARATERLQRMPVIQPVRISIARVDLDISAAGVEADRILEQRERGIQPVKVLPDLLAFLQKETELTRHTLVTILRASGRLPEFKINPQSFMAATADEISRALHEMMLDGIQYEQINGAVWEMTRFEADFEKEVLRELHRLYEVQNRDKSLYDFVEFESEVERQFARDLDANEHVRLFIKLPRWFKIDTPIGPYNPDWAFITEHEEKLYFVRETKSTTDADERRLKENQKIHCGKRHFETIGVDYGVVTRLAEVGF